MKKAVLEVRQVSKSFSHQKTGFVRLSRALGFGFSNDKNQFDVLKEISFTVENGETVGIIGKNGAGKSTLLKIISGSIAPSSGQILLDGRIGSILELGTGFDPDFTGSENIKYVTQLLGFSSGETKSYTESIKKFAAIGEFIDQPVKTYSSGMQMRLSFALATALRPDLLIIDEALSVGDLQFRKKCLHLIDEFKEKGTAILLVSHELETIKSLCDKVIFIGDGTIISSGDPKTVAELYEKMLLGEDNTETAASVKTPIAFLDPTLAKGQAQPIKYGTGQANIRETWIESTQQQPINVIEVGADFTLNMLVCFEENFDDIIFSIMIKNKDGVSVFGTDSGRVPMATKFFKAQETHQICFSVENNLAPGIYFINFGLRPANNSYSDFIDRIIDAETLMVTSNDLTTALVGSQNNKVSIHTLKVS